MKKLLLILPILLLAFYACKDPFIDKTYIEPTNEDLELTNASYLKKNADQFSLWIKLLKHADLYNALNDASSISTVFAPDNDAMEEFLAWKGVTTVEELDKNYAKSVAKVHILSNNLIESGFIAYVESGIIPIPTIFGTYISTSYGYTNTDVDDVDLPNSTPQDTLSIYLNNQARLKTLARTTSNGQVYALSGVIRPLVESIPEVLTTAKEYTIFLDALDKTGLKDTFSVVADTVYNLNGSYSVNDIRFTCFAVPDGVYNTSGIMNVEGLASYIGAGVDYTNPNNKMNQYVRYHFLTKENERSKLFTFQEAGQVVLFDTYLTSQVIAVNNDNIGNCINQNVRLIRSDIKASNGIIHKIDHIMPVYEPTPVTVRWDFTNFSDIQSFVNTYGAAKNLGDLYTSPLSGKDYQIDLSADMRDGNFGTISSILYKANPGKSSTAAWRKVGFYKCFYESSTLKTINKYNAYMDNLMILNLGYAGWVELKSPTIVKGRYKVKFYYAGAAGLKSYYTGGSLTKFNLDDYQKSIYLWKGLPAKFTDPLKQLNSNASGLAGDVIWEAVEFSTSKSHTFKATMMDINAKTSGSYRQMWDYLEFIPI